MNRYVRYKANVFNALCTEKKEEIMSCKYMIAMQ